MARLWDGIIPLFYKQHNTSFDYNDIYLVEKWNVELKAIYY